ncbi:MAG: PTS sugar transporter subunit IIA, partial [Verrucomicrobiota bacterium]
PHAKSAAVDTLKMAIGIAPGGIDFNALDGNPTNLFFLLVAPPDKAGPHVQALAEIAKLAQSKAFCRALINAENAAEVVELMRGD